MFTDAMAPEVFRTSKSFMNLKSSLLSWILSISLTDRTLSEDTVHVSSASDSKDKESLYGGQFTLSTQLMKPNYLTRLTAAFLPTPAALCTNVTALVT